MQSAVPDITSAVPKKSNKGWIGFDLDGTLAQYDKFQGLDHIGEPVNPNDPRSAFSQAKRYIAAGEDVRIFTARAAEGKAGIAPVQTWCQKYFGKVLPVTNQKDMHTNEFWDDRAVQVGKNTGIPVVPRKGA